MSRVHRSRRLVSTVVLGTLCLSLAAQAAMSPPLGSQAAGDRKGRPNDFLPI